MSVGLKHETPISRWQFARKFKDRLRRMRIKKADAKILKQLEDDASTASNVTLPRTLREALPEDPEAKANDPRAIVVTQCNGKFNMIGCNKAWENLCGYAECDIIGKDSSILQGPDTNNEGEFANVIVFENVFDYPSHLKREILSLKNQ